MTCNDFNGHFGCCLSFVVILFTLITLLRIFVINTDKISSFEEKFKYIIMQSKCEHSDFGEKYSIFLFPSVLLSHQRDNIM